MTPENHFPGLHIHILKTQAEDWIEKFPKAPVKRILLYSISFQLEGYMLEIIESYKPNPAIYAVVFEVDEEDKTINMTPCEQIEYDKQCICLMSIGYNGEFPQESYERLLFATQPNLRISDFKNLHLKYLKLVTADFANVYKWPPKDNYLEEWRFIVKFKNSELNANIRIDRPHVVLWEQKPQDKNKPKLRPNQEDKINCQEIAKKTWDKYPILDIVHMIKLPAIKKIVGKLYTDKAVHGWLKEEAPDHAHKGGRRSPELRLEQKKICEKLGIK